MYKVASEEVRKAVSEEGPVSFIIKNGWEGHGIDQNYIPYHIVSRKAGERKHIFDCYVSNTKLAFFLEHVKASDEIKNNKALMEVYFEKLLKDTINYASSIEKAVAIVTSELSFAAEVFLECKYEIRKTELNTNPLTIRGVYFIKEDVNK